MVLKTFPRYFKDNFLGQTYRSRPISGWSAGSSPQELNEFVFLTEWWDIVCGKKGDSFQNDP